MSTRSESLATAVDQSNKALLAAVEGSTPEQWAATCGDGEWTNGFAAFHAAVALGNIAQVVKSVAEGEPFPKITLEELDAQNAVQAREHADCTPAETVELIKKAAPAATSIVRSLSDEQLDGKVELFGGMPEVTLETLVQMAVIGHATYHRTTMTGVPQGAATIAGGTP
jgi:hypothetical protein